jgi:PAS domain S-box-containing protein
VSLPEDEQIEMFYQFSYLAECNDAMAKVFGYDSADQIIGARLGDLIAQPDPINIHFFREFKRAGYCLTNYETRGVDRRGNTKYFLNSLTGIVENGAVVRVWGTSQDITGRKQAELALRESEERMRRITDATQDALWEIDLKTKHLWWSEGARPLFGHSPAELEIGLEDWYNGIHPEDVDRVHAKFETFLQNGDLNWADEYRFRRADGSYAYIQDRGRKYRDKGGTPMRIAGAMVDITERKQAEEALRVSEEHARRQLAQIEAIYASAPVGLCFVDAEQRFININDRLAEINDKSVEEHLGRAVREAAPAMADAIEPSFRRVIETFEPILNAELSVETVAQPDGVRYFIASYYPIKSDGGRVVGVNMVVLEITQRKKIEEERERLLQQEKAAREDAEVANRMKDEFLATISHELRTPLTSILGWARMLDRGSLTETEKRHAVEVIAKSAQSQSSLIEDILDTSRIISGKFKLDTRPIEIVSVFQAAIDVVRPSAEAKRIALQVVIDCEDGVVLGDPVRLQQAIWNLLSNAVKFTTEGGAVEARLMVAGDQIEITISDTGVGIEPQFLPYVFNRFRQADTSSMRRYGGLGLGLALVRHIVEMHGGYVSASSPGKGQGATFKISIPVFSRQDLQQPQIQEPESEMKRTKEDDENDSHKIRRNSM